LCAGLFGGLLGSVSEVELFARVDLGEGVLRAPDRLAGAVVGRAVRGLLGPSAGGRLPFLRQEVEFGDLSVVVLEKLVGAVGIEPLLCGDLVTGAVEVDAAGGELGAGTVGVDPGDGGVRVPGGAGVVDDLQLGRASGGALGLDTRFGGCGQ
jgi:hypothetical protein